MEANSSSLSSMTSKTRPEHLETDIIKETRRLVANKSEQERFKIAKKHFFNALDFKKARIDLFEEDVPRAQVLVYNFQTNFLWRRFLELVAYLFMYACFFGHVNPSTDLIILESVLLVFFIIDFGLELYHKKMDSSKIKTRFYIRVVTVFLLIVDEIIAASTRELPVRPFLILRCVLPVMYDQQMRKITYALFASYMDILVYVVFYFSMIICFAVMANQFIQIPPSVEFNQFTENYGSLGRAFFIIYIMTTFDAYPDNQIIAVQLSNWIYGFFILFIFLNALFFVTIPTNLLLNSVKETRSKTVIIDEIYQQHNLIMAFVALGGNAKMSIPYENVVQFLLFVFNNEVKYLDKITEICRMLDEKVNGTIEVNQFLQLCKIIHSKNYLRPPRYSSWKRLNHFETFHEAKAKLRQFIRSKKFNAIIGVAILLTFINGILAMYTPIMLFKILDDILFFFYITEILMKFIALGGAQFFQRYWNTIDALIIIIAFIMKISNDESIPKHAAILIKMFRIFRVSVLVQFLSQTFNLSFKNRFYDKLSELINQIALIIPIVFKFFPLYMISFYFLGVVGVQIFNYQTDIKPEDSPFSNYDQFSNFRTLLGTHFVFVQVLTEAGWSMVAFDHAYRYGSFAFTMFFFVLCHEVIVIILTSVMKGVTWQVYNQIHEEHEDYKKKMADEEENRLHLKRRMEIFQETREKIQKHENIIPNNLVTRELYEKKIDQQILAKLIEIEIKNKGVFYHKKKKSNNFDTFPVEQVPLYKSIHLNSLKAHGGMKKTGNQNRVMQSPSKFLQIPRLKSNRPRMSISRKNMIEPPSPIHEESDRDFENMMQSEYAETPAEIEDLKQEDIEKEIDNVLDFIELHSGIKFSLKMQYPAGFVDYLKAKFRPLRVNNFDEGFDIENDVFAKKNSLNLMIFGLQSLLDVETTERERKSMILRAVVKKGLITEEKANRMLVQKSQTDRELTFDSNWIIRKTYLSSINEEKVTQFEIEYFSSVFGKSFKEINKIQLDPLIKLESKLTYCFSNLLRYRQVSTFEFFSTLSYIQNKISTKLFQVGSLFKFVYQIDTNSETWFTVELKESNELRVHFIKNGIWAYHQDVKKDEIYVARDVFNWQNISEREDKEQCAGYVKKFYESFESLAFSLRDFEKFFTPNPEMQTYDLYSFYRDVESSKRYVKKQLSISKIMTVLLTKEDEKDEPIPYSLSDIKFDDEQMEDYNKKKNKSFKLDQTEDEMFQKLRKYQMQEQDTISDNQGLPYAYIVNFMMHLRETMILNERNFIFHVEKLLNQHFKENEKIQCSTKFQRKPTEPPSSPSSPSSTV